MRRSNWKGHISFGLVSIPIELFNSHDPTSDISFKQINTKTGNKIRYKRTDVETDKEVPWEQIGKGYEYEKNTIIPVEENELKRVAGENAHTIAIEEFIDKKNINFLNIDKTYYLVPDKKGEKGYIILREALKSTNKVGIAKVIITTKEYLAAVATFDNAIVLHLLHYQDEIRQLTDLDIPNDDIKKYKVSSKEIEVAKKLINAMSAKWKPEKFQDEYKLAIKKWLNEKIHHLPETTMRKRSASTKTSSNVVSFVDLLKKSLANNKISVKTKSNKSSKRKHIPQKNDSARKTITHH